MIDYASRSTRLIGQAIDAFISFIPFIVVIVIQSAGVPVGPLGALSLLSCAAYYLFADGLAGGQSFAKILLGIAVVDVRSGEPCTFGQSFIRNFMLALLGPIDWIFIFGEQHQRLGDKAAGTVVVRINS